MADDPQSAVDRMLATKPATAQELRELLKLYMRLQPSTPAWFRATDLLVGTLLVREIRRTQDDEVVGLIVPQNGGNDGNS